MSEDYLIVPRKREKTGWHQYHSVTCERDEGESVLVLHHQASGH